MLRCSLSYVKIVQTEGKGTNLLEFYAEVQPILYKDTLILGVLQLSDAKLLQKSEMRKDIVIELSYKGFG